MRWRRGRGGGRRDPTPAPPRNTAPPGAGPILAVDVDGVIALFGFAEPPQPPEAGFEVIDGKLHCLSRAGAERLKRLADHYEIVWASGWEGRTRALSPLLGLPEIPYLRFGGEAEFGSADWKLGPLGEYASGRALAWIDDSFDESCYEWARQRAEPTLLVDADSHSGLLDVHVEALIGWARSLRTDADGEPA